MTEVAQKVDPIIKIHGIPLDIGSNKIFQVTSKYDADAPDGFRQNRSTKLLDDEAGKNTVSALFDEQTGLWDTGLYADSPMYSGLNPDARNEIANQVEELIVKPFDKIYAKKGVSPLDPTDEDSPFWNYGSNTSFKVDLFDGKIFNTEKPLDRLQLFICIANKDLAPREFENSPQFRRAQFCVENKEAVMDAKVESEMMEMEMMGKFYNFLDKPKSLQEILNFIGVKNVDVENRQLTTTVFKRFVDNKEQKYQNRKLFLDAVELHSTKTGKKEIEYYSSLQEMQKKGLLAKGLSNNYEIDGTELGTNLKAAAKFVKNKPKLQQKIDEILSEAK